MERPQSRLELIEQKLDWVMDGPASMGVLWTVAVIGPVLGLIAEVTGSRHPLLMGPMFVIVLLLVVYCVLRVVVEYPKPTRKPIDWDLKGLWVMIVIAIAVAIVVGAQGVWWPDDDDDRTMSWSLIVGGLFGAWLALRHVSKPVEVRPRRQRRRRRRRRSGSRSRSGKRRSGKQRRTDA